MVFIVNEMNKPSYAFEWHFMLLIQNCHEQKKNNNQIKPNITNRFHFRKQSFNDFTSFIAIDISCNPKANIHSSI